MKTYLDLCRDVLMNGVEKSDRTGTGTISVFGNMCKYDLSEGFPLVTTKKVKFSLISSELLWFLKGYTNIKYLLEHNNHIWDEWAFEKYIKSADYTGPDMTNFGLRSNEDPEFKKVYLKEKKEFCRLILEDETFAEKYGELGPVYGKQWRSWDSGDGQVIDQIHNVIEQIKKNPDSRRLIVSAWNPSVVDEQALPPCHTLFQFNVTDGKLNCSLFQRSGDIFLGIPFNIASYSLLVHIIAHLTGLEVGTFVHMIGDGHIYSNHVDQIKEQLSREPLNLPKLWINPECKSIEELTVDDIKLMGYEAHPAIKGAVAV